MDPRLQSPIDHVINPQATRQSSEWAGTMWPMKYALVVYYVMLTPPLMDVVKFVIYLFLYNFHCNMILPLTITHTALYLHVNKLF